MCVKIYQSTYLPDYIHTYDDGLDGFQNYLHSCALDESSHSIGWVKAVEVTTHTCLFLTFIILSVKHPPYLEHPEKRETPLFLVFLGISIITAFLDST